MKMFAKFNNDNFGVKLKKKVAVGAGQIRNRDSLNTLSAKHET